MAFYIGSTNVIDTDPVFDHEHVNESKLWTKSSEVNLGGAGSWSAQTINTYTNGLQPDHNNWEHWFITFKVDLIGGANTYGFTTSPQYKCKDTTAGDSDAEIMFNGGNSYPLNIDTAWFLHIQSWRQPEFIGPHELIITPYKPYDSNPTSSDWSMSSVSTGSRIWWGGVGGAGPNFTSASSTNHSIDLILPAYNGGTDLSVDIYATWK